VAEKAKKDNLGSISRTIILSVVSQSNSLCGSSDAAFRCQYCSNLLRLLSCCFCCLPTKWFTVQTSVLHGTSMSLTLPVDTRSSAVADGPREASCQLKSCQLPRNSTETTCTTSPEPNKYQLSLIDLCDKIVL